MNKSQKIIITVWIILLMVNAILTLNHYNVFFSGSLVEWAPEWGKFILLSFIVSIPAFILFKVWKDKK